MVPVDCFQKKKYETNFTAYDMIFKFEVVKNHKPDTFYLTETMRTEWIQVLDEYRD